MRNLSFLPAILSLAMLFSCAPKEKTVDPVDYVSTLTGTMSTYEISNGNTYPAVSMPWGMHAWTPQTGRNGDGWTYCYSATRIRGLKQTHQPSPWINDYGEFSIMPATGEIKFDENERESWFSHKTEVATPYEYSVYLADYDVTASVAATEHGAALNFVYPESQMSYFVVDAYDKGSSVRVEGNKVFGYTTRNSGGVTENFKNYFVIECDQTPTYTAVVSDGVLSEEFSEATCDHALAILGFPTSKGQNVLLRVGSSFISEEQAEQNLKAEVAGKTYAQVSAEGRKVWNDVLGRIMIEQKGESVDNLRTFYSCLYRSLLFPHNLSEITADGKRVHYSPYDGNIHDGYLFGDTGFWDTFRCLFPLLNLVYPDVAVNMQEGLVNDYLESGFLPEWSSPGHRGCMVGNNSASVVADAYIKGLRGYDTETLWKALVHDANDVHPEVSSTGRLGWEYYNALGYVPCDVDINENAARTLEYAYDDWCIYQFGKAIGKSEEEIAVYLKRSKNYTNLFDPKVGWMRGRKVDGSFPETFNPLKWGGDFTEGNAVHYTWSVFHDPEDLAALMGGKAEFEKKLDSVFDMPPVFDDSYYGFVIHEIREMQIMGMGNYAHGNQPIQHMIYLYNFTDSPYKTQSRVRETMNKLYTPDPDGYCGDEDNGQTSAWYVFSALGMYPVCPASDRYEMGTPLFKKATVTLPTGKKIVFSAPNNSEENFYVSSVKVGGKAYNDHALHHGDLIQGTKVEFKMTNSHE